MNILEILDGSLKTELLEIKNRMISQRGSLFLVSVIQIVLAFCNEERKNISLVPQRAFTTQYSLMQRLMNLLPKIFFQLLRSAAIESVIRWN